ncbi:MAG TPA: sigma-54 dependent transcriptional regulator, partial [Spirochaetia bacterium]|nr:sigma-54 dependent transcriptional regulator [Spirochaetia bacterium]
KAGGSDYLVKPVTSESLEHLFIREYEKSTIEHENDELDPFLSPESSEVPFIHADTRMREVLSAVYRARESSATVLITGESGTGKELVARLIHDSSDRRDKPFVTVNIAALPETLMESELFGHVKGAFTGADQSREGRFAEGDGGSLFIDEVGDIPLGIQVKLLRALQFGQIQRVGENATRTLDVRIIAATNRNLKGMMELGTFRADLYWRLNVIPIAIPPLRERREDIAALTRWFIEKFSKEYGRPVRGISREALSALMRHPFPGNVRELENAVERAVLMTRREILSTQDIQLESSSGATEPEGAASGTYDEVVGRFELDLIAKALEAAGGNRSEAARALGIGERRLRSRLKVLNEKLGPGR